MNPTQYFSDAYLEQCKQLNSDQIVQFLDDFRLINRPLTKSATKLVSIKIETDLLNAFKVQAQLDGMPYQTRIKKLMREWLSRKSQHVD